MIKQGLYGQTWYLSKLLHKLISNKYGNLLKELKVDIRLWCLWQIWYIYIPVLCGLMWLNGIQRQCRECCTLLFSIILTIFLYKYYLLHSRHQGVLTANVIRYHSFHSVQIDLCWMNVILFWNIKKWTHKRANLVNIVIYMALGFLPFAREILLAMMILYCIDKPVLNCVSLQ